MNQVAGAGLSLVKVFRISPFPFPPQSGAETQGQMYGEASELPRAHGEENAGPLLAGRAWACMAIMFSPTAGNTGSNTFQRPCQELRSSLPPSQTRLGG